MAHELDKVWVAIGLVVNESCRFIGKREWEEADRLLDRFNAGGLAQRTQHNAGIEETADWV